MAYVKQTFVDKETTLKAEHLQHIEDGIVSNETAINAIKIPGKVSELENDAGYMTSYEETDPTVPAWAKAETKPVYTAEEVGALPSETVIPAKTSDLVNDSSFATESFVVVKINEAQLGGGSGSGIDLSAYALKEDIPTTTSDLVNDSGFLTEYTEIDPTVPAWAKADKKPEYTAEEVGADTAGTADTKVSHHNTATDAHNDIRILVSALTERLNALANSDDTTLDQMAEVVTYIKDNRELIEAVTTAKVSVSDIVDNLTTNMTDRPLSAAQGVVLKSLVDALETKTNNTELWTFELEDGSTVTKTVVLR